VQEIAQESLITAAEAAKLLALPKKTVYRLSFSGEMPSVRISERCVRFSPAALMAWVRARSAGEVA
jgi:excisionase family DNA binding protein